MKTSNETLKALTVFEGTWKISGKNFSAKGNERDILIHGEDSCRWLSDRLVDNWKHVFSDGGHKGISIMGYDAEKERLFTKRFDNMGYERMYFLEQNNNTWTFNGDKERAVREYSQDGKSYVEHWEVRNGSNWLPLCVMNGERS